jgi:sulfopropanediol 3-dehydrogenase
MKSGRQLVTPTRDVAAVAWRDNGEVVVVDSEEAVKLSDEWAPEHLEVQTRDWRYYLDHCKTTDPRFSAKSDSSLWRQDHRNQSCLPNEGGPIYRRLSVGKFVKTVTYQYATKEASYKIADVCERACNYENMLAHGISCKVRKEKYSK